MMTFEEQEKRLDSVRRLKSAAFKAWIDKGDTAIKLSAFNTWFTPPVHLRDSIQARINNLFQESKAALKLHDKLEKEADKLLALPYTLTYESFDGTKKTLVCEGMLPDCSKTSQDEQEAMQMLALYYANKGKTEELPF